MDSLLMVTKPQVFLRWSGKDEGGEGNMGREESREKEEGKKGSCNATQLSPI